MTTALAFIHSFIDSTLSWINDSSPWIDGTHGVVGVIITSLFFVAAVSWLRRADGTSTAKVDNSENSWAVAAAKTPKVVAPTDANKKSNSESKGKDGGDKLRNVFSVKQKPIPIGNGSSSKKTSSEKPFESSYYFAHNKRSIGGGYKDGLRAEDYVMNGPRLLSKGGVRVGDEPKFDNAETTSEESIQPEKSDRKGRQKPKPMASTTITKYMWDDDGCSNVAKIHIDSLPVSSTETMKWESAGVSRERVEVCLIGENNEGLYASVVTHEGKKYQLHVPKMYGEAESVKCIVKRHKLLIKIVKKKILKRHSNRHSTGEGIWNFALKLLGKIAGGEDKEAKDEYISVAWPRLSAMSAGRLGGGTTDIDEKLFKEMDVKENEGDDFDMQWNR